jgi:hypothetical protein
MVMSEGTTGTRDEHYNVISVLYHALQGVETCGTYLQDAEQAGDQDLAQFLRGVQGTYRQLGIGVRCSCGNDSDRRMPVR